jgi:hypothetical protein
VTSYERSRPPTASRARAPARVARASQDRRPAFPQAAPITIASHRVCRTSAQ